MADGALRCASMFCLVGVAGEASAPHGLRAVGDVAVIAVIVGRYSVEPPAEALRVACTTFGVLLLDVGVVAVIAGCVVVSAIWEGDSHSLLALVALQAVIPLGDQFVLRRSELMADRAVDIHHLARFVMVVAVAFVARLLWGFEDVELEPMAAYTLRLLLLREDVNLVTCGVRHLEPLGVIACVTVLAGLVLDHRQFGDRIRVLEYYLPDVVKALDNVRLVAVMAVEVVHCAGVPGLIGVAHEVAGGAELWVVLRVIIDEVRWDSQHKESGNDDLLVSFNKIKYSHFTHT